jgi:hypothetical protein
MKRWLSSHFIVKLSKNSPNGNHELEKVTFYLKRYLSSVNNFPWNSKADSLNNGENVAEKSSFWKAGFSPKLLNNDCKGTFSPL